MVELDVAVQPLSVALAELSERALIPSGSAPRKPAIGHLRSPHPSAAQTISRTRAADVLHTSLATEHTSLASFHEKAPYI
jgi:hypothetical protein